MKKYVFIIFALYQILSAQEVRKDDLNYLLNQLNGNTEEDTNKVNIYSKLADLLSSDNPKEGIKYAEKGIEIGNKLNFKLGLSACYNNAGNCFQMLSEYNKSIEYFEKALKINLEEKSFTNASLNYSNMGNAYFAKADYQKAIECFFNSLKLDEQINDIHHLAYNYGNIGNVYLFQSDYKKAKEYFNKVFQFIKENDVESLDFLSLTYGNLGNIFFEEKNYDSALTCFNKSLLIAQKINNRYSIANTYGNLGMIYLRKKDWNRSFESLNISLKIQIDNDNLMGIMINKGNIGNLLYNIVIESQISEFNFKSQLRINNKEEYLRKSIEYSSEAIELGEKISAKKELIEWYLNLSNAQKILGDWKNAYLNLEKSKNLSDSVFSQENSNRIAKIEAARENEQIQRQSEYQKQKNNFYTIIIILLIIIAIVIIAYLFKKNKDNKILNEKNNQIENANLELEQLNEDLLQRELQLTELNATKDKFFSIIAHDLKNPLTALITGSDLLFNYYNRFNDADRLKNIGKLAESSKFLFKLLENLLQWARSQTESINFNPELNSISNLINENIELMRLNLNDKNINLTFNSNVETEFNFDKNMINTVIRNLFSNAIKFTPQGGKIDIKTELESDKIIISIKDSGVGISQENINKLFKIDKSFSTAGTNNEKGTGLGLIICHEFITKHRGQIEVNSQIEKGSTFKIILPF